MRVSAVCYPLASPSCSVMTSDITRLVLLEGGGDLVFSLCDLFKTWSCFPMAFSFCSHGSCNSADGLLVFTWIS